MNKTHQVDQILQENPNHFKDYLSGVKSFFEGGLNESSHHWQYLSEEEKQLAFFFETSIKKLVNIRQIATQIITR